MGTVYPETSYTEKLGYDHEIQFIPNTENFTIKNPKQIFKAVSRLNEDESRADCISFTVIEQSDEDKNHGMYRVKARIEKDVDDILIKPDCLELPRIIRTSPDFYSDGINANAPVIISYNIPVESESVSQNQSLFQFGAEKIRLLYGSTDMSPYFETPVLNSEKTTIKIVPKTKQLIQFINNQNAIYIDVTVSFGKEMAAVKDGVTVPLYESEASNFTIRYKPYEELTPPVKNSFFVTRTPMTLETASSIDGTQIFTQNDFITDLLEDTRNHTTEIIRNRNNGTIYIYGRFYDDESGVKSVKLTEQKTNEWQTSERVMDRLYEFTYYEDSENVEFASDENGYTEFCIKHQLVSEEGAVRVNVFVNDACANASKAESLSVIKRTYFDFYELDIYNFNNDIYFWRDYVDMNDYDRNHKKLKIYNFVDYDDNYYYGNMPSELAEVIYGEAVISGENFTIFAEYKDKNGVIRNEKFINFNEQEQYWSLDLDVDTVAGLKVKITVVDDIGVSGEKEFVFPQKLAISSVSAASNGKRVSFFKGNGTEYIQVFKRDEQGNFSGEKIISSFSDNLTAVFHTDGDYWLLPYGNDNYSGVNCFGELQHLVLGNNPPETPVITQAPVLTQSDFAQGWNANFEIENADIYDSIYCDYTFARSNGSSSGSRCIKNEEEYTPYIQISTSSLYSCINFTFSFYGIKDGLTSAKKTVTMNPITDPKYDDYPPSLSINRTSWDSYVIKVIDKESGPEFGILSVGNKTYILNSENSFSVTLPVSFLKDNLQSFNMGGSENDYCKINYLARDNSGNTVEDEEYMIISMDNYIPQISSYSKTDSGWKIKIKNVHSTINEGSRQYKYWKFTLCALGATGQWENEQLLETYALKEDQVSHFQNYTAVIQDSIPLQDNSFVRIFVKTSFDYGYPNYFYTGDPSTGVYDKLWIYGDKQVVSSDAPVFVHILSTSRPYSECKDWSVSEWENNHKIEELIYYGDFSSSNHAAVFSDLPLEQIEAGRCYCVIAHFANNTTAISDVMQK